MMKTTATAFFLPRKARKVKQRDAGGIAIWSAASPRSLSRRTSGLSLVAERRFCHLSSAVRRPPLSRRRSLENWAFLVAGAKRQSRFHIGVGCSPPPPPSPLPSAVRPRLAADTNAPWISAVRRPPLCHRRSLENWAFLAGCSPPPYAVAVRQLPVPSCQLPAVSPCPLRIKDRQSYLDSGSRLNLVPST